MENGLYLCSAFLVLCSAESSLPHKSAFTHSHTHSYTGGSGSQAMRGATCSSGAITIHMCTHTLMEEPPGAMWGSVSCLCRLKGPGIKPPTLTLMDDCSTSWATAIPIHNITGGKKKKRISLFKLFRQNNKTPRNYVKFWGTALARWLTLMLSSAAAHLSADFTRCLHQLGGLLKLPNPLGLSFSSAKPVAVSLYAIPTQTLAQLPPGLFL